MPKITTKEIIETEQKLNKKFSAIIEKMRDYFLEEIEKNNFSLLEGQYLSTKILEDFISYNQYILIRLKQETENKQ